MNSSRTFATTKSNVETQAQPISSSTTFFYPSSCGISTVFTLQLSHSTDHLALSSTCSPSPLLRSAPSSARQPSPFRRIEAPTRTPCGDPELLAFRRIIRHDLCYRRNNSTQSGGDLRLQFGFWVAFPPADPTFRSRYAASYDFPSPYNSHELFVPYRPVITPLSPELSLSVLYNQVDPLLLHPTTQLHSSRAATRCFINIQTVQPPFREVSGFTSHRLQSHRLTMNLKYPRPLDHV